MSPSNVRKRRYRLPTTCFCAHPIAAGDSTGKRPTRPLVTALMTDAASQALADAVLDADLEAVGRALRHDVVIVPLLLSDGEAQLRVAKTSAGHVLPLFSSSDAARNAFGPEAPFAVQFGSDLRPMLERNRELLTAVLFDSAGPRPMRLGVDELIAALEPRPDDDQVAWVTGARG